MTILTRRRLLAQATVATALGSSTVRADKVVRVGYQKGDGDELVGLARHQAGEPSRQSDPALGLLGNRRGVDDQQCSQQASALLGGSSQASAQL